MRWLSKSVPQLNHLMRKSFDWGSCASGDTTGRGAGRVCGIGRATVRSAARHALRRQNIEQGTRLAEGRQGGRRATRHTARPYRVACKYGLTLEAYDALVAQPCGICGTTDEPRVCDHDHGTGKVRGALCNPCNTGLHNIEKYGVQWGYDAHVYLKSHGSAKKQKKSKGISPHRQLSLVA